MLTIAAVNDENDEKLKSLENELAEARKSLITSGHAYFQNLYYGVNNQ